MFDEVSVNIDEKKDIISIKGIFGVRFKRGLEKKVLQSKRLNQLFITYGAFEIEFYRFFALEVVTVLEAYMEVPYLKNTKTLNNAIKAIYENTWLGDMGKEYEDTFDYGIIEEKLKFSILDHQSKFFSDYNGVKGRLHYNGNLLNAAPGSGKTFSSLALSELVYSNKVLIISPKPAIDTVWVDSLLNTVYKKPQSIYVYDNKKSYNGEKFIVVNYESMSKIDKIVQEIKGKDTTIIVDEFHNMNEIKSKRTNLLVEICREINSDNIILLTGTAIKGNGSLELVPLIEILDKRFNKVIKNRFIKLYKSMPTVLKRSISTRFNTYTTVVKKEELKLKPIITNIYPVILDNGKEFTLSVIKENMIKYAKDRIQELNKDYDIYVNRYKDLYKKVKDIILYEESKRINEFRIYENTIKTIINKYNANKLNEIPKEIEFSNKFEKEVIMPLLNPNEKVLFREAKSVYKYVKLKIQGEVLGRIVGRARIECSKAIAKDINYKELINSAVNKTLIFSNYVEVCEVSYDAINALGYKPLSVYGENTKYLTDVTTKFNNLNNDDNPLVATYKSLSTAVPLIGADILITIDLPFRDYQYSQATARLNRLGQNEQVYVYQAILDTGDAPNISSRTVDIINFSKEVAELITGITVDSEIIKHSGTDAGNVSLEEFFYVNDELKKKEFNEHHLEW